MGCVGIQGDIAESVAVGSCRDGPVGSVALFSHLGWGVIMSVM